jgi:hypothetical protein
MGDRACRQLVFLFARTLIKAGRNFSPLGVPFRIAVRGPFHGEGEKAMYHSIEFVGDFMVDLEITPKQPLERILVHKGTRLQAQIKPYVVETAEGPVEVADLYFEDGTTTRMVRWECFAFAE